MEIKKTKLSSLEKTACAKVIADTNAHQKTHGIISDPSSKGSNAPHVLGKAVDIPKDVASTLMKKTTNKIFIRYNGCIFCKPFSFVINGDVEDYVNSSTINPPPCNLIWGGRFKRTHPDNVHFQLP